MLLRGPGCSYCSLLLAGLLGACTAASGQQPLHRIAFDPHKDEVAIAAEIRGAPVRMLVDTAVDPAGLHTATAARLGFMPGEPGGAVEGVGSKTVEAFPVVLDTLIIDGEAQPEVEALVFDMGPILARYEAPLDGVLGYGWLKSRPILIDYPADTLTMGPANALRETVARCTLRHEFPVRFRSDDDHSLIVPDVSVGGFAAPAIIDTGSSGMVRIEVDAPLLAGLASRLPVGEASQSTGTRGTADVRRAKLSLPLAVGPFRLERPDASYSGPQMPDAPYLLGNGFFRAVGARLFVNMPGGQVGIYGNCGD